MGEHGHAGRRRVVFAVQQPVAATLVQIGLGQRAEHGAGGACRSRGAAVRHAVEQLDLLARERLLGFEGQRGAVQRHACHVLALVVSRAEDHAVPGAEPLGQPGQRPHAIERVREHGLVDAEVQAGLFERG